MHSSSSEWSPEECASPRTGVCGGEKRLGFARLSIGSSPRASESSTSPPSTSYIEFTWADMETPVKREFEELDEDESEDLKMSESPAPYAPGDLNRRLSSSSSVPPPKRPRGRPRKHPIPSPDAQAKVAKGRSKTGCITCRRRKKKCDETKPQCLNCQKNAVVCEGYPERVVWKSGREKAEEGK
ncbi:MAG: hypothetical protein M1837_000460 [Sclerophora amabilis]|nr:MAG: hypothetical protein M1837_000460 [Sclerophora amabilis]